MTTTENLTIRPAEKADMGAIAGIYAKAVETGLASFELQPPDESEMGRRFEGLVDAGYPYLVAEYGGQIAGYCYVGPFRPRPAYRWCVENSVYVGDEWQEKGIGKRLLASLIEACTALEYRQMIAVIGDSANLASIKLHENAGFQYVGTIKDVGRKHGKWLDSVTMQLALGEGATSDPKFEP